MHMIKNLIRRNLIITLCELWYKLNINKGNVRKICSLYIVVKKDFYIVINIKNTCKYVLRSINNQYTIFCLSITIKMLKY